MRRASLAAVAVIVAGLQSYAEQPASLDPLTVAKTAELAVAAANLCPGFLLNDRAFRMYLSRGGLTLQSAHQQFHAEMMDVLREFVTLARADDGEADCSRAYGILGPAALGMMSRRR